MSTQESLTAELYEELQPGTTLENILFRQIARAAWRLEQCEQREQPDTGRIVSTALNVMLKATAELRRLQTNRSIGHEIRPEAPAQGLATHKEVATAVAGHERRLALAPKRKPADSSFCKTAQTPEKPHIPRGAPCPCNSGIRYKRCCGKDAPPVLHHRARVIAEDALPKAA